MCTCNVRTEDDNNRKTCETNSGEPSGISSTIATKREENGVLCDSVQCNKLESIREGIGISLCKVRMMRRYNVDSSVRP